jgi:hypothetical protein
MRPFTTAGRLGSSHLGSSIIGAGVVLSVYAGTQVKDYLSTSKDHRQVPWRNDTLLIDAGLLGWGMAYGALCAQPRWQHGAVLAAVATPVILLALDEHPPALNEHQSRLETLRRTDPADVVDLAWYGSVFGLCAWLINRLVARFI